MTETTSEKTSAAKKTLCFFCILTAFLISCSGSSSDKEFKANHLKFHQEQLKFVEDQKKLLIEELEKLSRGLDSNADLYIVNGHWTLFREYAEEFKNKNEIFIEDMIVNDKTTGVVINTRDLNVEISGIIKPDIVDVEAALSDPIGYQKAKTYINKFRERIPRMIDEMQQQIKKYNDSFAG